MRIKSRRNYIYQAEGKGTRNTKFVFRGKLSELNLQIKGGLWSQQAELLTPTCYANEVASPSVPRPPLPNKTLVISSDDLNVRASLLAVITDASGHTIVYRDNNLPTCFKVINV